MNLSDILKDSEYKLSQFKPEEIEWLEQTIFLKSSTKGDVAYIKCLVRGKDMKLTPEEAVRQLYLKVLTSRYHYPTSRIQVEYGVNFGREVKRADIVVMDKQRPNTVYIVVEVKKPKLKDGRNNFIPIVMALVRRWLFGQMESKSPSISVKILIILILLVISLTPIRSFLIL